MISVRFQLNQPILALMLMLVMGGFSVGAEPASSGVKPKPAQVVLSEASLTEDARVVINIPSRTLWVYSGEKIVRFFPVGVGRVGFPTPIGKYSIIRKVLDPGWENPYLSHGKMRLAPGENNPLGTRWMGFLQDPKGEYGMHGTDNPTSVGKFSSHGCVRLKVSDAEALFDLVDVGTPVEVVYQPVIIRQHADQVRVAVYSDRFKRGMPSLDKVRADILTQFPNATVDELKLKAALSQPLEKFISVGSIFQADALGSRMIHPGHPPALTPDLPLHPIENLSDHNRL